MPIVSIVVSFLGFGQLEIREFVRYPQEGTTRESKGKARVEGHVS